MLIFGKETGNSGGTSLVRIEFKERKEGRMSLGVIRTFQGEGDECRACLANSKTSTYCALTFYSSCGEEGRECPFEEHYPLLRVNFQILGKRR